MSWKSLLVHLRPYQTTQAALAPALSIAQRFGASVTGLYTMRELAMLKLIMGENHPAVREAAARDAPLAREAETSFLKACDEAGVTGVFQVAEGNANELLCHAARVHDVLFIERSTSGSLDGRGGDMVEECAVAAGTPTLIIPATGAKSFGDCVVVAWNHSRQSAAALHAALPLIERARSVVVLLGQDRDAMPSVTERPLADVGAYLRRHARDVRVIPYKGAGDGASLQAAALDAGGDVLVMGAYGRSAWREFLFGGATRDVISQLRLPVLMAH